MITKQHFTPLRFYNDRISSLPNPAIDLENNSAVGNGRQTKT